MSEPNCCVLCNCELDGSSFFDDTCDECARTEGWLEDDEE